MQSDLMKRLQRVVFAAAVVLPTAGAAVVSMPIGLVGLTAASDSAAAQDCGQRPKKAKSKVGECLRRAGAQWGRNPTTGNCSFWTRGPRARGPVWRDLEIQVKGGLWRAWVSSRAGADAR